jgi:hypothetical protein
MFPPAAVMANPDPAIFKKNPAQTISTVLMAAELPPSS